MKELNKKIEEEYKKSITLRNLDLYDTSFEHGRKIQKEQEESYKKCMFFTELRKAMKKGNKK